MAQPLIVGPREGAMPYIGRVYRQFSVRWGREIRRLYPKLNTNIKFEGLVHSLDRVKLLWWGEGLGFQIFPCLP